MVHARKGDDQRRGGIAGNSPGDAVRALRSVNDGVQGLDALLRTKHVGSARVDVRVDAANTSLVPIVRHVVQGNGPVGAGANGGVGNGTGIPRGVCRAKGDFTIVVAVRGSAQGNGKDVLLEKAGTLQCRQKVFVGTTVHRHAEDAVKGEVDKIRGSIRSQSKLICQAHAGHLDGIVDQLAADRSRPVGNGEFLGARLQRARVAGPKGVVQGAGLRRAVGAHDPT